MLWTYDMMSFQKIYSPTQLANAMKLVFKILQSLELSMTLCDAKNASPEATEQQDLEW